MKIDRKKFNIYERIVLRIHRKLFNKYHHYVRIELVNKILQTDKPQKKE